MTRYRTRARAGIVAIALGLAPLIAYGQRRPTKPRPPGP